MCLLEPRSAHVFRVLCALLCLVLVFANIRSSSTCIYVASRIAPGRVVRLRCETGAGNGIFFFWFGLTTSIVLYLLLHSLL